MVRFILTVPDRLKSAVLHQMLAWREEAMPDTCEIRVIEKRAHGDNAPAAETVAAEVPVQSISVVPASPATSSVDRSTKQYRVIDTAAKVGPIPHQVRMYLIDHPNSTCKQLVAATGRGQKSIESALWLLRDRGIVKESARTL